MEEFRGKLPLIIKSINDNTTDIYKCYLSMCRDTENNRYKIILGPES